MLVLSSPSGAGKTSIAKRLLEAEAELTLSVSVTTRTMRANEVDGRDYSFIDKAQFDRLVAAHALLEHAEVFGNHYGTPSEPVREVVTGRAGLMGLTAEEQSDPDNLVPKFKNGTFNIIRAGGYAGKYSAIIPSIGGRGSIEPVTREIR